MASTDKTFQKWGSEHAAGMGRLGLRELRGAFYTGSNVAQQAEYGVFGMKTPGEVAESRRGEEIDLEDEIAKGRSSILEDRMRQAEGRDGHGHDDKGLEPER